MIVVDASVVIKWFVEEPLHSEARHILEYQLDIQAPDFILFEVANAAWKKVVLRNEIESEHARRIVSLTAESIPILIPSLQILKRATELALTLKHPVYDCLYLACLTDQHDTLVTGDKKFFDKVRKTKSGDRVRFLDDPELALPLYLALHKADEIIHFSELLVQAHGNLHSILTGDQEFEIVNSADFQPVFDSPAAQRLHDLIPSLNKEELADVLALGWLGRGHEGSDWIKIREQAKAAIKNSNSQYLRYIEGMTIYLEKGLAVLRGLK